MADDVKAIAVPCCGCFGLAFFLFLIVLLSSIKVVEINQQLVFKTNKGKHVRNGPFTAVIWPHQRMERREAARIGQREYAVIRDERKQTLRHHTEPGLVFLGPYEQLVEVKGKVVLQMNQYTRFVDKLSGAERVVSGPQVMVPKPLEHAPAGTELCPIIGATNALLVENRSSGIKSVITQKGMFVPRPYERVLGQRDATLLETNQFAVVKDELSGLLRNELGPQLLVLGPYEKMMGVQVKVVLEKDEYYRLVNKRTGTERVMMGPTVVVAEPGETNEEGKQKAVFITVQTGVIVEYRTTGQQRLETNPGIFYPGPYERIKSVTNRMAVRPSEASVVRHSSGNVTVRRGESFFLDPYSTVVEYSWSNYGRPGAQEPVPKDKVRLIDLRVRRMFMSTEVRTNDQVKLKLDAIVFWRVDDVQLMVTKTADPPGDIAQRARTTLVQAVSGTTLAAFMADFNQISVEATTRARSETFYTDRGLRFEGLEVTRFDSVERETALILQNIIYETTNRLNNLAKAESTNQINAAKMLANIELERQRTNLIRRQAENAKLESQSTGESAGSKMLRAAQTFIGGLNVSVPDLDQRVELYQLQESLKSRNIDTQNLASGSAHLFLAPKDLNLKLNSPEL